MRVVIDLQACQTTGSRTRGIGRYSMSLLQALARNAGGHELWLLLNGLFPETIVPIRQKFSESIPRDRIKIFHAPAPAAAADPANDWRIRAAERIREHAIAQLAPDVLHVSSLFEGLCDDAVTSVGQFEPGLATAVTLYDLIPLMRAETYLDNPVVRNWYYRKLQSLKNANLLLAISEHSRREAIGALNLPPERVVNISSAIDPHFNRLALSDDRVRQLRLQYGIPRPFVMYTGGIDFRKNIEGLIMAYAALPHDVRAKRQLAIVCSVKDADRSRLLDLARKHGLATNDVILTGFVPEEDLVGLYNLCELFIFPSLHEGFGLPALEAMACGAAVIGSNTSSIPEVIGREDALFDPNRVEAITAALHNALTNDAFRQSLREHAPGQAAQFSWDASARRVVAAFEFLHEQRAHHELTQVMMPSKPRLAVVSPLPPEQSGIADYCAELIPELARFYEITLIVDQKSIEHPWLTANFTHRDVHWFEANASRFDRILYHFGNSPFHTHMFGLLERYPGVVVLHDFYLGHVVQSLEAAGYPSRRFLQELYHSHGYPGVATFAREGKDAAIWAWPCSKRVFDDAAGVIVHSSYSIDAARRYYGEQAAEEIVQIRQLYALPDELNATQSRAALGIAAEDFVVCSFGMLTPTKLNDKLLDAWLESGLGMSARCRLIFVGENPAGEYGRALVARIRKSGVRDRIMITGFVNPDIYRQYLAVADVAVQLRTLSRGETSRAALEAMAHGIPLIANANGPLAEYPEGVLHMLPDEFSRKELIQSLERLHSDSDVRNRLGAAGRRYISEKHAPAQAGGQFFHAIERFAGTSNRVRNQRLIDSLAAIESTAHPSESDVRLAAEAISALAPAGGPRQLLMDISVLVEHDAKSGIQRVVRSILMQLLHRPPPSCRVEPIYFDGERYYYARSFTVRLLGITDPCLADEAIDAMPGDIFLGLDLTAHLIEKTKNTLAAFNASGVRVYFIVYDILLIHHPEWWDKGTHEMFLQWLEAIAEVSNGLICISRSVADEVKIWLDENPPPRVEPLRIGFFHLGADIENSSPTRGLPDTAAHLLRMIEKAPTFLMVGTIEPRKGHALALAAFERLWAEDVAVNLCIVGKQGWLMEEFVERLRCHTQLDKQLFWLEGISDEYLEMIYANSTVLLTASEGEGFGLPLIEAAQHKLPIIARDIPVFREVAGNHAYYFNGNLPDDLAAAVKAWLDLYSQGKVPNSAGMTWLNWDQSAARLVDVIFNDCWYASWSPASG